MKSFSHWTHFYIFQDERKMKLFGKNPQTGNKEQAVATGVTSANAVAFAATQPHVLLQHPAGAVSAGSTTRTNPLLVKLKSTQPNTDMTPIRQGKLFNLLDGICAKYTEPLTIDQLRQIVPAASIFKDGKRSNVYTDFYTSPSFAPPDGYTINQLEARVAKSGQCINILILSFDNVPVSMKALQDQYGKLLPTGESPLEMIFFQKQQPWGELRFGYSQDRPDLLKVVVFDKAGH